MLRLFGCKLKMDILNKNKVYFYVLYNLKRELYYQCIIVEMIYFML